MSSSSPEKPRPTDITMPRVQKYRTRACQSCARSKLKCGWPSETANSCDRCTRLRTSCVLPEVNNRRRRGPSKRGGRLEEKLNGIISLLNADRSDIAAHVQHHSSNHQSPQPEPQSETRMPWVRNPTGGDSVRHGRENSAVPSPIVGNHATTGLNMPSQPDSIEIVPGFEVDLSTADTHLNEYRATFAPRFPFVPIPVIASALELVETAPFLLRTILQVVTPQTLEVQRSVQRWFRQYLAQHIIVDQERRLELLQAILVFVAWGDFQFYLESQATDLLQLAGILVIDLGLDKSPNSLGVAGQSFIPDAIRKVNRSRKEEGTLDHMRAMLGLCYLESVVTTLYRRTRTFAFTPYIMYCCNTLLAAQEHDSDKFLVVLVHMQRILTRVSPGISSLNQDENSPQAVTVALHMTMATARKELDQCIQDLSADPSIVLLWTSYYGTLIRLYEPVIHMRPASNFREPQETARRTETLSNCLQAAKDFFAAYARIPLESLGALPLVATAYLAFALVTVSRILLIDDLDWDPSLARRHLDFAAVCQTIADRFHQADCLAQALRQRRRFDNSVDASVLAAYHVKITWIRTWYLAKVSAAMRPAVTKQPSLPLSGVMTGSLAAQSMGANDSMLSPMEMDEAFWNALIAKQSQ